MKNKKQKTKKNEKRKKKERKNPFISNITSREIKWKKGRLTRLGCWGWGIKSFLQFSQVFLHCSSLELINSCLFQSIVECALLPTSSLLQCHGGIQCLQPVLELFHWSRQNAGREIIKKMKMKKKNSRKEQTYFMAGTVGA